MTDRLLPNSVRFIAPWGIGPAIVLFWHFWATFFCIVGAYVGTPFTKYMQIQADKREVKGGVNGVAAHDEGDAENRKRIIKPD